MRMFAVHALSRTWVEGLEYLVSRHPQYPVITSIIAGLHPYFVLVPI